MPGQIVCLQIARIYPKNKLAPVSHKNTEGVTEFYTFLPTPSSQQRNTQIR